MVIFSSSPPAFHLKAMKSRRSCRSDSTCRRNTRCALAPWGIPPSPTTTESSSKVNSLPNQHGFLPFQWEPPQFCRKNHRKDCPKRPLGEAEDKGLFRHLRDLLHEHLLAIFELRQELLLRFSAWERPKRVKSRGKWRPRHGHRGIDPPPDPSRSSPTSCLSTACTLGARSNKHSINPGSPRPFLKWSCAKVHF